MKIKCFIIFLFTSAQVLGQNPALFEGKFLKFRIKQSGVYALQVSFLKQHFQNFDESKLLIISSNAGSLPQKNSETPLDYLKSIPIKINDNQIYFYAEGASELTINENGFHFIRNPYEQFSYVYIGLSDKPSPRIEKVKTVNIKAREVNYFFSYHRMEEDKRNLLESGREWVGDFFSTEQNFNIDNIDNIDGKLFTKTRLAAQTNVESTIISSIEEKKGKPIQLRPTRYRASDAYLRYERIANFSVTKDTFEVKKPSGILNYKFAEPQTSLNGASIDYLEYYYKKQLKYLDTQQTLYFLPDSNNINLNFSNNPIGNILWKVSGQKIVEIDLNNSVHTSLKEGDKLQLFKYDNAYNPEFIKELYFDTENELKPELIIVYPKSFENSAVELKKLRTSNGLSVLAISIEHVYDLFSGGKTDPSAIRNLARYFWMRENSKLKYLCLLGDASYDYKNLQNNSFVNIENLIPTYESRESFEPIYSYSSDDYFGFLEDHEGEWEEGFSINNVWYKSTSEDHTLDISVGRIPVQSDQQGLAVIKKLENYEINTNKEKWARTIGFVADNGDYNIHQKFVEEFSDYLSNSNSPFIQKKVFIDNFSSQTQENLGAKNAFNQLIEEGALIINYNGHGSESGWAQEKILTIDQIQNWNNKNALPLFFTATCQFGKFDNPNVVSGAELALLNPNAGASALFSTTRPVYASSNKEINSAFFESLLELINKGEFKIGDLFRLTKNRSILNESNRNFSLIGDPSMRLAFQNKNKIIIDSINYGDQKTGILRALENSTIQGHLSDSINGELNIEIYDKPSNLQTLGLASNSTKMTYKLSENLLYKGKTTIENGKFRFNFVVPKDIDYKIGNGSIYLSAYHNDQTYLNLNSAVKVGDVLPNPKIDTIGPKITAGIENGILKANISDESGINISNYGLGHYTSLTIDKNQPINITEYLKNKNNYKEYSLEFDLSTINIKGSTIKLKTFDTYNNESYVALNWGSNDLLTEVNVYPNPVNQILNVDLDLSNNLNYLDLKVNIYSKNGQLISEISKSCKPCADNYNFRLNLCDFLTNEGIYLYNIVDAATNKILKKGKILYTP